MSDEFAAGFGVGVVISMALAGALSAMSDDTDWERKYKAQAVDAQVQHQHLRKSTRLANEAIAQRDEAIRVLGDKLAEATSADGQLTIELEAGILALKDILDAHKAKSETASSCKREC